MKMKIEALLLILAALQTLCSPQSLCRDDSISSSPPRVGSSSSKPRWIDIICSQDHRVTAVEEPIFPLDMALNSADDQFDGCSDKMAIKVDNYYLNNEKNGNPNFKTAWEIGEKNAVKPSPENPLSRNHLIAIYVYTDRIVYEDFNKAVRNGKPTYENSNYKWYSLHFLLTDAVQILKKSQDDCYNTYRGTNVKINDANVLNTEVRLGTFVSSSLDPNKIKPFGKKSCFEIRTCKGADISKYSKLPHEKEVLIPPYETFKVTKVQRKTENKNLWWCETVFTLESYEKKSDLNCTLFKTPSRGAFPQKRHNSRRRNKKIFSQNLH
ncbi:LOW QUALITY PROTEIN: T-cell ecto-ADP-ribosyltransferase 2-like [Danio aesculapii]|uniref:LOW QUALITY PROTEIN: T-cell ecto-ADP-ribosyltransferase 2-like n=1 Tax=Danio aesculapii TaxID=1142201 RepID=UPI0024BF5B12|nr:LOW QUALITY PROTEIN: T-cell ecto-ADP-ribosyltransferase 2-like [Danio aesculapii]